MQQSIRFLLASAIIATPLLGQSSPPPPRLAQSTAKAESLGSTPRRELRDEEGTATTPTKSRPTTAAKPAKKTWTGGRNGFVVDSAEAASLWPVKGPEPLPGAIVPAKRIVAYYGNPLVKKWEFW